jgi:hypothetical protein
MYVPLHLVADSVTSRVKENRDTAIDLLRQAGAVVSSKEIVIFQWAGRANKENFKKFCLLSNRREIKEEFINESSFNFSQY